MLRRETGPTFSDLWYRVEGTHPRLSPHAQVTRQMYGLEVSYIVEDPAGSSYYRMTEPAYFFLGLLDGKRTVGEAWDACIAQRGDEAPTQRECIDLLGKLQLYGLLLGELPLAPDMVFERKRQSRQRRWMQRTGRGLFPNIPIVNPEPFLERHKGFVKLCFSGWGLALWLVLGTIAVWRVALNWSDISSPQQFVAMIAPDNLLLLSIAFTVMRALHELGHAAACKARGGRVTEIGLMLIAFVLPIPYCDASSSAKFPRTRDRVLVGAGGVLVEMFFAAIAAIIWSYTESGTWLNALCRNIMVLSSVTTLVFNLNPLLRYDGYYILSDLLAIPNLAQKSRDMWHFMVQRGLFGIRVVRPPQVRSRVEAATLLVYGAAATPYKLIVMVTILLVVANMYLGLGIVLAAVLTSVWVIWPALKGIGYLVSSPQLMGHRPRAWGVTALGIGAVAVLLGVVPAPAGSVAIGMIEPAANHPLRATEGGFIRALNAAPGQTLRVGDPVYEFQSPDLDTDLAMAGARVRKARAKHNWATLRGSRADERVELRELEQLEADLTRVRQRHGALVLTAPANGVFVAPMPEVLEPQNLTGRFFPRGTLLGYVATLDTLVVRVAISDKEAAYVFKESDITAALERGVLENVNVPARIRVPGRLWETVSGRVVRMVPAGSRDLLSPSLGTAAGGDIAPDPDDSSGKKTLVPQFVLEIVPDETPEGWVPGLRARARFDLPREPLLWQWWRVGRQYVKGHLG